MEISTKRILAALVVAITITLATAIIANAKVSRPCYASETDFGAVTISQASAMVSGDYSVYANLQVRDRYSDGRYAAAHFIVYVNGYKVADLWYGVPDGGSTTLTYDNDVGYKIRGVAEGYFGVKDSVADAEAYWTRYCPTSHQIG